MWRTRPQAARTAPVQVADTVSAGDCFLTGLLVALLSRPSFQSANRVDELALNEQDVQKVPCHPVASTSLCVWQTGPSLATVDPGLAASRPAFREV
ncbi:hypothetical protein [Hydrogenophaga sp.]|uniref:hypothetical protein n=1 Tax=Hydrogenophaga sp. TaxID=1904254 RepID=UPI0025BD015F|nr:hypothetical protein [Hydrogenophaga sp.]